MKKQVIAGIILGFSILSTLLFLYSLFVASKKTIILFFLFATLCLWLVFFELFKKFHAEHQNMINKIMHRFKGKLEETCWTQVHLQESSPEKLGIYSIDETSNERFYAKIISCRGSSFWKNQLPYIMLAVIKDGEWITEETPLIRSSIENFEEYFSFKE